ncbi:MAG: ABC transporter ATP-binding protein [Syntrophobacteraceae bacterium]|jgi:branched-chain amino acid transport system ATP-binding protein|nr:ABC transporter ATP-binding protein [Syntrophobacteraceae bacterium]
MEDKPCKSAVLEVRFLTVGYHDTPVLREVSLGLSADQIVAVVGPNGAGKSTLLKTIAGLIQPSEGAILLDGEPIQGLPVWERVRRGIVYVPEGMSVFPDMSVLENLEIGAYLNRRSISSRLQHVHELFPELRERISQRASTLSGGQKRMLTLGRGLMAGARILLLDDPFLGLSPIIVRRFCEAFRAIRQSGVTLFIAGQHVRRILNVADLAFLIEDGNITLSGPGDEIFGNAHLQQILFGAQIRPVGF